MRMMELYQMEDEFQENLNPRYLYLCSNVKIRSFIGN